MVEEPRKSFLRQALRALALGFKRPLYQKGRPVDCMAKEAAGKPCDCGSVYCKGDKP